MAMFALDDRGNAVCALLSGARAALGAAAWAVGRQGSEEVDRKALEG